MSLFAKPTPAVSSTQIQQLKAWAADILKLEAATPISISQLRCHKPGCPPVETAIAVMTEPPKTHKIHKAAADLSYDDVVSALES